MNEYTYSLKNRIMALALSLVMVLHMMPVLGINTQAAGVSAGSVVTDPSTMDEWKDIFLPNGVPSTDYAGSVWTDKTVLTSGQTLPGNVQINDNNFLVALSALGSNSVVTGMGSVPTDVVFVLDISGSMNGNYTNMVAATNNAIRTMMDNPENRVGVVLYSSETVETLLPLDHYTGVTSGNTTVYLSYVSGNGYGTIFTGTRTRNQNGGGPGGGGNYVYTRPTNSDGNPVAKNVSCGGGTYTQAGIWESFNEHFKNVTLEDGDTRVPAIILMSDGAPTYNTPYFDNVPINNRTYGAGNSSFAGDGFVTGLTISYLKAQLKAKYGKSLIYTVGFGLNSIDNERDEAVATKVLNPLYAHTEIDQLWKEYLTLKAGETMTVGLGMNGGSPEDDYTTNVSITATDTVLSATYVDRYLAANDAGSLNDAFQNIVNDIAIQAGYYPTRTDDNGTNYSGYITFSDTIGPGMEVESIKGILLDGKLHDGHLMAQAIFDENSDYWVGTKESPTAMGDEFVRAVKTRMGIHVEPASDSEEDVEAARVAENNIAWELIRNAYLEGQLAYDKDAGTYSNYIAWYGDANGNYLSPYKESGTRPEGAAFVNFCYGMLGATEATGLSSDLMYVTVQMSRNLSTGNRMVTFQIPAAMLPVLTYKIDVELDDNNDIIADSATISVNNAQPISLLYEVGVDEEIVNSMTVKDYGIKADDGRYYLYASAWDDETDKDVLANTRTNSMAYAHFEPNQQNEHYFFAEDKLLYNSDNTPYTASTRPTGNVYFQDVIYTATGALGTDGAYKANVHTVYIPMAASDLGNATQTVGGTTWYMPKGAMYANTYNYDKAKSENTTGTHNYAHYGLFTTAISGVSGYDYELMYQGNNGRLAYEPAQGITLTKELAEGATVLEDKTFTFTVDITDDTDGKVTLFQNGTSTEKTLDGGKLNVTLKANETVTIYDIDTGASYTVKEVISDEDSYDYKLILVNGQTADEAIGTVEEYTLTPVTFTNDTIDYGSFTVTKHVTYNKGTAAVQDKLAEFTVDVTLEGYANRKILINGSEMLTDANGKVTFKIKDGQTVTISRVPVGTAYTVVEQTPTQKGYALTGYTDTDNINDGKGIVTATTTGVIVNNTYTPADVTPQDYTVNITGTKYLNDGTATIPLGEHEFLFELLYYNTETGQWTNVEYSGAKVRDSVTGDDANFSLDFNETFSQVGDYLYRIKEVVPTSPTPGMTYDTADHDFRIVVTDNDLDGSLEMNAEAIDSKVIVTEPSQNTWSIEAEFNNVYILNSTSWNPVAKKVLTGRTLRDGEFTFRMEALNNAPVPAGHVSVLQAVNGKNGDTTFHSITFTQQHLENQPVEGYQYKLTEVEPTPKLGGVTYDKAEYIISVKLVADNGNVKVGSVTYTKNGNPYTEELPLFTNTYKAESVLAGPFEAEKTLNNLTLGAVGPMAMTNGQFEFSLTAQNNAPMPTGFENGKLYNDANGKITIPAITYDKAGTYTYTLNEVVGNAAGYTYDTKSYMVTVVVTDPGDGQLAISSTTFERIKTGDEEDNTPVTAMTFTNTYKAAATGNIALGGTKVLENTDSTFTRTLNADEFSFNITGNGIDETVTNDANGKFNFTALKFDHVGTFTYTVTEVPGNLGGVKYDGKNYSLEIAVTDNGNDGQLDATAKLNGDSVALNNITFDFKNTYTADPTGKIFTARKTLNGRSLKSGEFSFTLSGSGVNETVKNDADGNVSFSTITYTKAGTYDYTVTEVKGNLGGVKYDQSTYTIVVTVIDDGNGDLVVDSTKVNGIENGGLNFINTYEAADVKATIEATKTLTNATPGVTDTNMTLTADQFNFTLTAVTAGAPMPAANKVGNGADGKVTFTINYTDADTYVYELREAVDDYDYITHDPMVYTVTVTVTDPGDGQLVAAVAYANDEGTLEAKDVKFNNKYEAKSTTLTIHGRKNLTGRPVEYPLKDNEFSFILTAITNGAPVPADTEVKNLANGTFKFEGFTFDTVGSYQYKITEKFAGQKIEGVTYSEQEYTITVKVSDNGSGQLIAVIAEGSKGTEADPAQFDNKYIPESHEAVIYGDKVLTNIAPGIAEADKDMNVAANAYSFKLEAITNDAPMPTVAEVKNLAGGSFSFGPIKYTKTGEYQYKVTEIPGSLSYIDYDETVYTVTVKVTDDEGKGYLTATVISDYGTETAPVIFTNTYDAEDAKLTIGGEKELKGRKLKADEFTFKLYETDKHFTVKQDGTVKEAKNKANKTFAFETLTFSNVGTYYYVVEEDDSNKLERVKYDDTKYYITVTVTDDTENGKLKAVSKVKTSPDATDTTEKIVFTNKFTPKPTDITVDINIDKKVENKGSESITPEGFEFAFKKDDAAEPQKVKTGKDGKAKFTLNFTEDDIGKTYNYSLTEVDDGRANVKYSTAKYDIAITVSLDDNNKLVTSITQNTVAVASVVAEFVNEYNYTPATPPTEDIPSSPQTGDNSNLTLWLALLFVSGGGLIGTSLYIRKKKEEDK